jgi:hypothetical protein
MKGTGILQSCTVSLDVVPGSCSETNITSYDDTREFIGINFEEDTDVTMKVDEIIIKVEEIPEPISFLPIKAEPEEVS